MTDIQKIVDAPDAVKALKDNLITIDKDLASLQTISDRQWESLGQAVLEQSKAAIALCAESCQKFRTTLARLTRHSNLDQGKLSRRDRVMIGFFSRDEFKSMSEELQSCKHTLNLAVTVAVL
jgi:Tol biopolymer transport system component